MASPSDAPIVLFSLLTFLIAAADGTRFGFDLHHRFSAESRAHQLPGGWLERGSASYYAALAGHDRRRLLTSAPQEQLTFADGNATVRLNSLGFLHYALVSSGLQM